VIRRARSIASLFCALIVLGAASCGEKAPMPHLVDEETNADIVGPTDKHLELALDAEVLIDATTSMSGYATVEGSVFNRFVEELEAAIRSGAKQAKLAFYKFGTSVRPIEREVAVLRKPAAFFAEKGIFEQTRLEDAIDSPDPAKDRIILTDLFQNEGDVNKVVAAFKEKCFDRGRDVGILMVRSEFDGVVYDAKVPPYRYVSKAGELASNRAFFAIFVGDAARFGRIVEALKSTRVASAIDDDAFLVLSRHAVKGYKVQFEVPKGKARKIRITKSGKPNPFENGVDVHLLPGATEEELITRITIDPVPFGPRLTLEKLYLIAKQATMKPGGKVKGAPDVRDTDEIRPKSLAAQGRTLTATLTIGAPTAPVEKKGRTLYKLLFALPAELGAFEPPARIVEQSSDDPRPGAGPEKTVNLEKFTRDLIRAWATAQPRYVAKAYIRAERK